MKTPVWALALAIVLLGVVTTLATTIEPGKPAPPFELKDQFGKTWKLSDLKGRVVVLVAGTKDSSKLLSPWAKELRSKYATGKQEDQVQILRLLDLHTVSSMFHGAARSRIRKETQNPYLLDFKSTVAKTYEVSDQHPVVVVIDKEGIVRSVQKTKCDKEAFAATTRGIDQALGAKH